MDKSQITLTRGSEWWIERLTTSNRERYPKIIKVGKLENPRIYLPERTCRKIPGRMKYGTRLPKCSECGQSLGDKRWKFCPNCGGKIINE